ncbi:hypothetical protein RhiirA4_479248 [Rhizophagus irregularis]|uniref:Uncharacterized protein n=1 Tax=Rhizophagus irregularis TaxID=588596 RepID=A0A2I1HG59_9GLOM|nr:hypothetical protein RhiirA4_479248 [Rhizophagus irregularis]
MALQSVIDHHKLQGKYTLPEMIYDGKDVKGYSYKPVIAFHVVEMFCKIKKKDGEVKIIREGNFDLSFRQMNQHLCDNHELCWPEVCWIKNNPELQLLEPTFKSYTSSQHEKLKSMFNRNNLSSSYQPRHF